MNESLRRLNVATYAVAAFFVFSPIVDILTNSWPIAVGQEEWRFGFIGVASNYLVSVLFGMILASLLAAAAGHRTMLRLLGWLSWAIVAVLVFMELSLVLDTLQLRSAVRPDAVEMFKIGAAKTAAKIAAVVVVMTLLAIGCLRAAKQIVVSRPDRDHIPLVLGG